MNSKKEVEYVRIVHQLVKTHIEEGENVIPNKSLVKNPCFRLRRWPVRLLAF